MEAHIMFVFDCNYQLGGRVRKRKAIFLGALLV